MPHCVAEGLKLGILKIIVGDVAWYLPLRHIPLNTHQSISRKLQIMLSDASMIELKEIGYKKKPLR